METIHQSKLGFNVDMILNERDATDSKKVKRSLILQGYKHQYSFYGQILNDAGEKEFRRYEVFSDTILGSVLLQDLKKTLEDTETNYNYMLIAYSSVRRGYQIVKGYGKELY